MLTRTSGLMVARDSTAAGVSSAVRRAGRSPAPVASRRARVGDVGPGGQVA